PIGAAPRGCSAATPARRFRICRRSAGPYNDRMKRARRFGCLLLVGLPACGSEPGARPDPVESAPPPAPVPGAMAPLGMDPVLPPSSEPLAPVAANGPASSEQPPPVQGLAPASDGSTPPAAGDTPGVE